MKSLKLRWNEHKRDAIKGIDTHFYRAIRKYGADDFISEILEQNIDRNKLADREKYWIEHYDTYSNGYNSTKGGDGTNGFKHTPETKLKISRSNKGKKKTIEHCKNIKIALNNIPTEIKESKNKNQSEKMLGRKLSENHKAKISESLKGRKLSKEHIEKSAKARTGLKRSEEQNKRNSKAQKGKKLSEKTKLKISKSSKGKGSLIIEIYNNRDKLINISYNNFREFCKENGYPYDAFYKSYNNNEKLYNTKQKLTFAKKKGFEIYLGWYAINKGTK